MTGPIDITPPARRRPAQPGSSAIAGPVDVTPAAPPAPLAVAGPGPREQLVLTGRDLWLRRGDRTILAGVSVHAEPGEPLALSGPSGSGKSTLLAVLAGLISPDSGTVLLGDAAVRPGDVASRRSIGLILQGYGLIGLLTAAENVEVGLRAHGTSPREARDRAFTALGTLGLAGREHHLVEDLSGGQQQRVAVARALAAEPSVILADEPTAELDHDTRDHVLAVLLECAGDGATLILATHDPDIADQCSASLHLVDGAPAQP